MKTNLTKFCTKISQSIFKKCVKNNNNNCVKCGRIRSFSGSYFPALGLNTDEKSSENLFSKQSRHFWTFFWNFPPPNCYKQTEKMDWNFSKLQIDVHHCMCINENNWGNSRCMTLLQRHFFSFFTQVFIKLFHQRWRLFDFEVVFFESAMIF